MKMLIRAMDGYRRSARSHPALFVCINLILVISWTGLIMRFSGENAEVSGGRSARILVTLVRAIAPSSGVTLDNYETVLVLDNCEKVLRKLAHMTEYGILAALVWSALYGIKKLSRRIRSLIPPLFVCMIGSIDEINQTRVDGRYGSWFDVCVDLLGALIALIVIYRLIRLYDLRKDMMNSRPGA